MAKLPVFDIPQQTLRPVAPAEERRTQSRFAQAAPYLQSAISIASDQYNKVSAYQAQEAANSYDKAQAAALLEAQQNLTGKSALAKTDAPGAMPAARPAPATSVTPGPKASAPAENLPPVAAQTVPDNSPDELFLRSEGSPYAAYYKRLDDAAEEIGKGLNSQALDMFNSHRSRSSVGFTTALLEHRAKQQKIYEDSVNLDTIATSESLLVTNYTRPAESDAAMGSIEAAVRAMNPGVKVDAKVKELQSKAALSALHAAAQREDMVLPGLNNLQKWMTPEDKAAAQMLAEKSDAPLMGNSMAKRDFRDGITENEIVSLTDAIREEHGDKVADSYFSSMHQRLQSNKATEIAYDRDFLAGMEIKAYKPGTNLTLLEREMESDPTLTIQAKANGAQFLRSLRKANEAEYKARLNDPNTMSPQQLDAYNLVRSPEFGSMSFQNVRDLAKDMGSHWGGWVLERHAIASADGGRLAVPPPVMKAITLDFAQRLGVKSKKLSDEQNESLNMAIAGATDFFSAESKGKGTFATKPPTNQDWIDQINRRLTPVKVSDPWFGKDVFKPVSELTPKDAKAALEFVDGDMKAVAIDQLRLTLGRYPSPQEVLLFAEDQKRLNANPEMLDAYNKLANRIRSKVDSVPKEFQKNPFRIPVGGRKQGDAN